MARAHIELPPGWGPARLLMTAWENAGYQVTHCRYPGLGEAVAEIRASGDREPRRDPPRDRRGTPGPVRH